MKYLMPIALFALVLGTAAPAALASTGSNLVESSYGSDGYWVTERVRYWVEGCHSRVWIEPIYEYRYRSCGSRYRHCVREGRYERRYTRGHWDYRTERRWVERGHRRGHRGYPSSRRRGCGHRGYGHSSGVTIGVGINF